MVFLDGVGEGNGVSFWYDLVLPYTKSSVFICPSRPTPKLHEQEVFTCGYALNADLNQAHRAFDTTVYTGKSETAVSVQSNLVAIFEARAGFIANDWPDREISVHGMSPADMQEEIKAQKPGAFRHRDGANYAFVDGHAKWLRPRVFVSPCDETHPCFEP
jgi:prepilin-type processing-associated H-X9-DG protein